MQIFVAGLTIDGARRAIAEKLYEKQIREEKIKEPSEKKFNEILDGVRVEVQEFNSKFYYIITDGGGYGAQIFRRPYTGNEMVLDGLALVQGLPAVASKKKIWVARATPDHGPNPYILPVDWCGIVQRGEGETNYQLYPGDRIFVHSDALIRADSALGKFLAPIERLLGVTLLGSSVVSSIRSGSNVGNIGGFVAP
jgi:polysaccharide export outer membrane protein